MKKYLFKIAFLIVLILLLLYYRGENDQKLQAKSVSSIQEEYHNEKSQTVQQAEDLDPSFEQYLVDKYSQPISAVEYLFALSLTGDINAYPNAFSSAQYFEDYFNIHSDIPVPELINENMRRLTRDGTLQTVELIREIGSFNKSSKRIVVDLKYNDLPKPVRVNIKVLKSEPNNYYYIDSSVWELIDKIEGGG